MIMEHPQSSVTAGKEAVYKCRKCRHTLFRGDFIVNGHGSGVGLSPKEEDKCNYGGVPVEDAVWFLKEDLLPDWVEALVNKANWIKGKITCPKCNGKIGSFDFINGTKCPCGRFVLPSVHIVKGKVDREDFSAAVALPLLSVPMDAIEKQDTESTKEEPPQPFSVSALRTSPLDLVLFQQDTSFQVPDISGVDTFGISKGKIRKPCRENSNYLNAKRRKGFDCTTDGQNTEVEAPEEDICAICLDIYHHPFICYPCTHVFCEICLRSLAKLDPQHTRCPLCRQYIGLCVPDSDCCQRTKSLYPKYYKARQIPLNNTRNFPLPWQANYRLRQLSSGGLGHFWLGWQDDNSQTSVAQTVWDSLSTVSILIALHVIALITFLTGYYGCHYFPILITLMLEELEQIVNDANTLLTS